MSTPNTENNVTVKNESELFMSCKCGHTYKVNVNWTIADAWSLEVFFAPGNCPNCDIRNQVQIKRSVKGNPESRIV